MRGEIAGTVNDTSDSDPFSNCCCLGELKGGGKAIDLSRLSRVMTSQSY